MRPWLYGAGAVGIAFLLGVGTGRWSQPTREIRTTVRTSGAVSAVNVVAQRQTDTSTASDRRVITRWIPQPQRCDGGPAVPPIIERVEESVRTVDTSSRAATAAARLDAKVASTSTTTIVAREPPRWHADILIGTSALSLNVQTFRYGVTVTRDIGPFEVGGWTMRGAGIGGGVVLGVRF